MGTWNIKINGSDTFQDVYQNFFDLYNEGLDPADISKKITEEFSAMFNDSDDRNPCLFALIQAQWETKSIDDVLFKKVKEIIETGDDLLVWKSLGADEKTVNRRKIVLDKFLTQISTQREKPKRRVKPKFEFTFNERINIVSPDGKKRFSANEYFTNGVYTQTGSGIMWPTGGGSVFYFTGEGLFIDAKWLDSQTLEIRHDKHIVFFKKEESFFYSGDTGKVLYIPI